MSQEQAKVEDAWTVSRLLEWTRGYFDRLGIDEPRLATEILLARALECRRIDLYTRFDRVPDGPQLDAFRSLVHRAAEHTPIAYLVGSKEFFSLEFDVSPAVLIPRPETEILVEQAIDHARGLGTEGLQILDVGTGSGCIAVTLLKHLPTALAVATDVSADALEVARRNAKRHGVADRLRLVEADRLALPADARPAEGFDLLVSNPPYVAAHEMSSLAPTIREHEPAAALTDGEDGLSFFRTLASEGPQWLANQGALLVEIADGQGDAVREIFASSHRFEHVATHRDTVGPHERVLHFRCP